MTLTTAESSGDVCRLTMVCNVCTICAATTIRSMPRCGHAACVPRPRSTMPKLSAQASAGPAPHGELAGRKIGPVVHAVDGGHRKHLEQSFAHHHARAGNIFLGRLEDEVHGPVEIARLRKIARRPSSIAVWPS